MLQQWLGVTQKALCNIHRAAVGLRDPCVTLDKCNDVFRQNAFCWVRIVSKASSAHKLLIPEDMTVSVRGMRRCPESSWQKYRHSCSDICNTDLLFAHENGFAICCAQGVHRGLAGAGR